MCKGASEEGGLGNKCCYLGALAPRGPYMNECSRLNSQAGQQARELRPNRKERRADGLNEEKCLPFIHPQVVTLEA